MPVMLCVLLGGSIGAVPAYNSNGLWLISFFWATTPLQLGISEEVLDATHLSRNPNRAFQRRAVPAASLRRGHIGGRQKEVEQQSVRLSRVPDGVVWQNELA